MTYRSPTLELDFKSQTECEFFPSYLSIQVTFVFDKRGKINVYNFQAMLLIRMGSELRVYSHQTNAKTKAASVGVG